MENGQGFVLFWRSWRVCCPWDSLIYRAIPQFSPVEHGRLYTVQDSYTGAAREVQTIAVQVKLFPGFSRKINKELLLQWFFKENKTNWARTINKSLSGSLHFITFIDSYSAKGLKIRLKCMLFIETFMYLLLLRFKTEIYEDRQLGTHGVDEQYNRTLCERVWCMLSTTNLPHAFWGETLQSAVHILNQSPHNSLNSGILGEICFGKLALYDHQPIFGCEAIIHVS